MKILIIGGTGTISSAIVPEQAERDIRLYRGCTWQYVYVSSASAYNKPAANYVITERTIVRPNHTYCEHR